jgi:hypothetical protein
MQAFFFGLHHWLLLQQQCELDGDLSVLFLDRRGDDVKGVCHNSSNQTGDVIDWSISDPSKAEHRVYTLQYMIRHQYWNFIRFELQSSVFYYQSRRSLQQIFTACLRTKEQMLTE